MLWHRFGSEDCWLNNADFTIFEGKLFWDSAEWLLLGSQFQIIWPDYKEFNCLALSSKVPGSIPSILEFNFHNRFWVQSVHALLELKIDERVPGTGGSTHSYRYSTGMIPYHLSKCNHFLGFMQSLANLLWWWLGIELKVLKVNIAMTDAVIILSPFLGCYHANAKPTNKIDAPEQTTIDARNLFGEKMYRYDGNSTAISTQIMNTQIWSGKNAKKDRHITIPTYSTPQDALALIRR